MVEDVLALPRPGEVRRFVDVDMIFFLLGHGDADAEEDENVVVDEEIMRITEM